MSTNNKWCDGSKCKRCGGPATAPLYWPCSTCLEEIQEKSVSMKEAGLTANDIALKLDAPKRYVLRVLREYRQSKKDSKQTSNFRLGHAQFDNREEAKLWAVRYKGGCCKVCGYSKNYSALCFHHRDPKDKLFCLGGDEIQYYKPELVLAELGKCDLLCHNCHQEHHRPDCAMD